MCLAAYAAFLVGLMVVHHLVMTGLSILGTMLRLPLALGKFLHDSDSGEEECEGGPWRNPLRTWLAHFRSGDPDAHIGPMLLEQDGPGIHIVVAEMACKVGSPIPEEIRLTYLPCCGVIEQRVWAGLRPRRRILVLGLPLLYVLSIEELRAVVAHELAHLSRGDAALAFVVSQFIDSLDRSIDAGAHTAWGWLNPCVLLAWFVRGAFRVLSCPLSRYQEYRADAIAAAVCGSDTVTNSLQNAALVQPIFREVLCQYHPVAIHNVNLYSFFLLSWTAIDEAFKQELKETLLLEEPASLFDPHPRLRARLGKIRRYSTHREPDARPARRLLEHRQNLEEVLHNYIYRTRSPHLTVYRPSE